MSPTLDAFLRSWPFDPWLLAGLGLAAGIYLRGWLALYRQNPQRWHAGLLSAFLGGLATVYLALASPIEPFSALLLQVHMLQHLLLMMVAPALYWLGAPMLPMLRGLPRPIRTYWVVPLMRSRALREFFSRLTHPAAALPILVAATWLWHAPGAYQLALTSSGWHYLQHACFFAAGLVFWYPVIRPYPSHPRWSLWLLLPYLILADVQNTLLSALLTFSNRVLYPYYLQIPRLGRLTALEDQSAAGLLMWVPGSIAFLVPLFVIGSRLLYAEEPGRKGQKSNAECRTRPATFRLRHPPFDLLRCPLIGQFLKWRHARLAMQAPMGALAGLLIFDGLHGTQVSAMNLAGVLPWIHWRGLLILSLLVAGNFFCMACPFLLPRTAARALFSRGNKGRAEGRRWLPTGRHWPRWLRSKWLSVVLLILFLWAYEALSLWNSPWWTAWLAIGYFVGAFVVDGFFRDAAFCKYVCPIGQFNFVQSLVSPLEVKARDRDICATCQTKDCIRGNKGIRDWGLGIGPNPQSRRPQRSDISNPQSLIPNPAVPGCELHLFQPRKTGNMDCTFCLDCVHACPHDNVGILARPLGSELWRPAPQRAGLASSSAASSIGKRPDLAALIVVLVFGAFVNAAGMVAPILAWRDRLESLVNPTSPLLVTGLLYLVGLVVLPLAAVGSAAVLSRRWGRPSAMWYEVAARYSYALVPIGFSMWLAHYSFHLLTSYDTVIPAMQSFAQDLGWSSFGSPHCIASCCRPVANWLPRLEVVFLDLGLLLSLYTAYRIALVGSPTLSRALREMAPWALLITLLFAAGIWIVFQPMQMRGT